MGDPLERDIEKIEWDTINGYISYSIRIKLEF
jgi:hypothetical protein